MVSTQQSGASTGFSLKIQAGANAVTSHSNRARKESREVFHWDGPLPTPTGIKLEAIRVVETRAGAVANTWSAKVHQKVPTRVCGGRQRGGHCEIPPQLRAKDPNKVASYFSLVCTSRSTSVKRVATLQLRSVTLQCTSRVGVAFHIQLRIVSILSLQLIMIIPTLIRIVTRIFASGSTTTLLIHL